MTNKQGFGNRGGSDIKLDTLGANYDGEGAISTLFFPPHAERAAEFVLPIRARGGAMKSPGSGVTGIYRRNMARL